MLKFSKAAGGVSKSFTAALLATPSLTEEEEHAIKWFAAFFYGGMSPLFHALAIRHFAFILGAVDTVSGTRLFRRAYITFYVRPFRL